MVDILSTLSNNASSCELFMIFDIIFTVSFAYELGNHKNKNEKILNLFHLQEKLTAFVVVSATKMLAIRKTK